MFILTKEHFIELIKIIQTLIDKDRALARALQEYADDTDFTDFFSHTPDKLVAWLAKLTQDKTPDGLLDWWFWEAPILPRDINYDVTFPDGKTINVKLPENLFEALEYQTQFAEES